MFNKFFGAIGHIKLVNNGNFINNQEKLFLLDKINNTNLDWINIDSSINHEMFQEPEENIRRFMYDVKKNKKINIMITVHITQDTPWNQYFHSILLKNTDIIVLNLTISPYLINNKQKQKILQNFYNINDNKLILNEAFLSLDGEILKKYCQGLLINGVQTPKECYGTIIFNGLNFFHQQNHWEQFLLQGYNNIIHCTHWLGWSPLETLHSAIVFNDNQLKLSIIKNIQKVENNKSDETNFIENLWEAVDGLIQKNNDLFFDLNN
jgi:hypothetical protein